MSDRAGQVLGNYKLLRLLGQGGFSDVYLAEHIHLNTYAAIKILHAQLAEDNLENFRTEARTLAHLKHPGIVQVLDFGVVGRTPYLAMQHALNGTLRQRHPGGVPVALNLVVSYVRSMAAALEYAHNQNLIHRDVKPENMLIGEQNQILLSDFGIAVVDASSHKPGTSFDPMGTVAYMAPEQIQGKAVPASDQYALAIVVYEWLAGVLPFNGNYMAIMSQQVSASPTPLRKKMPSISADVEQVVLIALNKNPQKRFGHMKAFAQALEQAAQVEQGDIVASHQKKPLEVSTMEAALISPLGRTILGATKVTIGRAPDNTLVLADAKVSPYHAEVRPDGPYYALVDQSHGNETFVNEQVVYSGVPRLLQPGDMIRIGDTRFTFTVDNRAQNVPSGEYPGTSATIAGPQSNVPNYPGNTGYGMGNYAGPPPPPGQPFIYPDIQPTYISPNGPQPQQPGYTPNYNGSPLSQPGLPPQQPGYTPNYNGSPLSQPGLPPQQPGYTPNYSGPPLSQPGLPPQQSGYTPNYSGPPATPKRSPMMKIVSGVIAVIIIIACVSGLFLYRNNQVAQDHIHATATAQTLASNHATAIVVTQQNATVTAIANTGLTATAVATSPYMPFAKVALNDPLTTANTNWNVGSSICQFAATGYQVSIAQAGTIQYCVNGGKFGEMAYQATMNIHQGDCGGLVFRVIDANNFYFFEVCQDGTYNLGDYIAGKLTTLGAQTSSIIKHGLDVQNLIAVTVQGNTINMYVNGSRIDTATNPALVTNTFLQGQVGVLSDDVTNPTSTIYTNALVWTAQ